MADVNKFKDKQKTSIIIIQTILGQPYELLLYFAEEAAVSTFFQAEVVANLPQLLPRQHPEYVRGALRAPPRY